MFRTNFLIVDEDWNLITEYKGRIKPNIDELIYLEPRYFKIISIIHTFKLSPITKNITIVVKELKNLK